MAAEAELTNYLSKAYHTLMADRHLPGIVREAIKDIRSTFMEFFFSRAEHGSEPGTPLAPLFSDQAAARSYHLSFLGNNPRGSFAMPTDPNQPVPSVSEILDNPGAFLPEQGNANGVRHSNAMDAGQAPAMNAGQSGGVPSVAAILDNPQAYLSAEQQLGQQQQQSHGMSM